MGFDAYGTAAVIIAATMITWSVSTMAYAPLHPVSRLLLEAPLAAAWWMPRNGALVIGGLVLAVVSGLGVSAFGP